MQAAVGQMTIIVYMHLSSTIMGMRQAVLIKQILLLYMHLYRLFTGSKISSILLIFSLIIYSLFY